MKNKIKNKAQLKKAINIVTTSSYGGVSSMSLVSDGVITDDLVSFVFTSTCDELHYLNDKTVMQYDSYDVSNFISYVRRHTAIANSLETNMDVCGM